MNLESCITELSNEIPLSEYGDAGTHLSDRQLSLLRANILDYHECLIEKESHDVAAFDDNLVDTVIRNSDYLHYTLC